MKMSLNGDTKGSLAAAQRRKCEPGRSRQINPRGILVCPPAYFQVIDRKNPFMDASLPVDRDLAEQQWRGVVDAFAHSGFFVHELTPLPNCEDMVFTANPAFTGIDSSGRQRCVASNMRFASRRREVAPQVAYLDSAGYALDTHLDADVGFEGGGDAVWDFKGHRIFLGTGPRTHAAAAMLLRDTFGVEVVTLRLQTERFYHLDTALAILDGEKAILYPEAFDEASNATLAHYFPKAIRVDEIEANRMACNAAMAGANTVIIDSGATKTIDDLLERNYVVAAVPTSEFMKSGGSVYCMKQYLF